MRNKVICGQVPDAMKEILAGSVQCVLTSPPYWGLRKYEGVEPQEWPEVVFVPAAGLSEITIPGWRGCLGNEPDPWQYVAHMVLIFREVRHILRDDGVVWFNVGDSFCSQGGKRTKGSSDSGVGRADAPGTRINVGDLKPKDLIGIPWMLAKALQADGWYLRSDIIWAKGI